MVFFEVIKRFTKLNESEQQALMTKYAEEKGIIGNPNKIIRHLPDFFNWLAVNINSVKSE